MNAMKTAYDEIDFQGDFVNDLAEESGYGHKIDVRDIFKVWKGHKEENLLTYRDKQFTSLYTGNTSPPPPKTFMEALDDSMAAFIG